MAAFFKFEGGIQSVAHVGGPLRFTKERAATCISVQLNDDELEYVRATFPDIHLGTKRVVTIEGADAQKIAEEWGREEV
jgi:hypothetical protein